MADVKITILGQVASVCGSCGCSGTQPLSEGPPACCENRALFARSSGVVSLWLNDHEHHVGYSEQWYEAVIAEVRESPKGVAGMRDYIDAYLQVPVTNPRGIRVISRV